MATHYRHTRRPENRLGRHYKRLRRFSPAPPLSFNYLSRKICRTAERISEVRLALDQSGNSLADIIEGGIPARPFADRHRLAIRRQRLQLGKVAPPPETGSQNDRDHTGRPGLVPRQGALELDTTDVIRNEKIGADQQQDDISRLKPGAGGAGPIGTGGDIAFIPDLDQPLPVQDRISSQACDHSTRLPDTMIGWRASPIAST